MQVYLYISQSTLLSRTMLHKINGRSVNLYSWVFFLNTQIVFAHELTMDMVPKHCKLKAFDGAIKIFCQF